MQGVINWINGGDIPTKIRDSNFNQMRFLTLQTRLYAVYKGLMAQFMKAWSRDFLNGDSIEISTFFDQAINIHPIFPLAFHEEQKLPRDKWNSIVNKIKHLSLQEQTESMEKITRGIPPRTTKSGITSEKDSLLRDHHIEPTILRSNDFDWFIQTRAGYLLDLIEQATGKTITDRDS